MSLNDAPSAERVHIGIFGRRNAGKSSIINAITGQDLAIVSDVAGTTTDPVIKSMEILPLGPVTIIDTPGLDDEGELGALRIQKAYRMLNKTDVAILVVDGRIGVTHEDEAILERIARKKIPCILVLNKADLMSPRTPGRAGEKISAGDGNSLNAILKSTENDGVIPGEFPPACLKSAGNTGTIPLEAAQACLIKVSAKTGENIRELKEMIARLGTKEESDRKIVGDLLHPMDFVVLVVPIDSAAPKGRLILPQQQTIRDVLDTGAVAVVAKDTELEGTLERLGTSPRLVITDSQAFGEVAQIVPPDVPLTSFSILMARYKGDLQRLVEGAYTLDRLQDGDKVLISEGCTHHRQCDDIGTVKLPRLIREYTGKEISFEFTSGVEFPDSLSKYSLIVHCGGCMLNRREMEYRLKCAEDHLVPMTNYGTAIAHMKGILARSLAPFA